VFEFRVWFFRPLIRVQGVGSDAHPHQKHEARR
jgi:hypothetical protein